jgi:hypothetical protein
MAALGCVKQRALEGPIQAAIGCQRTKKYSA